MSIEISVNDLAGAARAITRADSPADVFRALLDASRATTPRAAVFLVRRGDVHGWGTVGFPTDVASAHRGFRATADQGWLGQLARKSGFPSARGADQSDRAPRLNRAGYDVECLRGAFLIGEDDGLYFDIACEGWGQ